MISQTLVDGVRILRIDRPDKKNALTGGMYTALAEALENGNADPDVGCHLICGHPGAFTAGNDIADFLTIAGKVPMSETPVVRFLRALVRAEKPMVAAVDGVAVGVGTTLLLHCDMVFASETSVFRTPFVDLGLVPEAGSSLLGPKLLGYPHAFELLCLGRPFSAKKAHEAGLVNQVVAADVNDVALECAREIAAKPREAMVLSRALLRGNTTELAERVEQEAELFAKRLSSPEAIGAFQAFMAKGGVK